MPPTQEQLWSTLCAPDRLFLIAGPCVIEDEALCLRVAEHLRKLCEELGLRYVFKASFDKANRTSSLSPRGPGVEAGLAVLARVREQLDVPVLTDVHTEAQAEVAAECVDVLQIPAFLCRQTDLVHAAARSGRIVNLKKGQFLSPREMEHAIAKAREAGNGRVLVTERGASFGYHDLVVDMRSIPILRRTGCPVVFDATHAVQQPGAAGDRSGGQREFVPALARAAVAAGADGLFLETHPDPDRAWSDGPNALALSDVGPLLESAVAIHGVVRGCADVAGLRRSRT